MNDKRVFLVDGYSLLYRSFYAIRGLSSAAGFPTNAIFGFLTTLKKIRDTESLDYLGVILDSRGPTFRHERYDKYKAQRKPMPEDLSVQIPVLRKIMAAMRIPVLEHEKYEADDVLGALSRKASSLRVRTVLVTTDKDLYQLVDDMVEIYNPVKGQYFDRDGVKKVFGVFPDQVRDVLALWGDPSDNVPGVPGIGEKTAKALITDFGTIENLMDNLSQIKPRIREKIEGNLDQMRLSRELVTIDKDLDVPFEPERFRLSEPDTPELLRLFEELGMQSLASEYRESPSPEELSYSTILDEKRLKTLIKAIEKAGYVSLDTETTHLQPTQASLVGLSLAINPSEAFYIPLEHDYPGAPEQLTKEKAFSLLRPVFQSPEIKKLGQNIKSVSYTHLRAHET